MPKTKALPPVPPEVEARIRALVSRPEYQRDIEQALADVAGGDMGRPVRRAEQ